MSVTEVKKTTLEDVFPGIESVVLNIARYCHRFVNPSPSGSSPALLLV